MTNVNKKLATNSAEIESDDLLFEIFLRLPLYSIQGLKTACKQWQSLLTNSTFLKQWRNKNLKLSTALVGSRLDYLVQLSPNKPTNLPSLRTDLTVTQSCNGLLLCWSYSQGVRNMVFTYHVYNPTNGTCHTVPELGGRLGGNYEIKATALAFDPNRSLYYKIIRVVKSYNNGLCVYIYPSDSRTWKLVSKSNSAKVNDKGVYWNGAINWMKKLTYFDIESESFKAMPKLPEFGDMIRMDYYVGESCDRFSYVALLKPKSGNSCIVHVYDLKRDYSEWFLKYNVELDYIICDTFLLSLIRGVDEDDSSLVLNTGEGIVRYDIVSEKSEKVSSRDGNMDHVFQYIESHYVC